MAAPGGGLDGKASKQVDDYFAVKNDAEDDNKKEANAGTSGGASGPVQSDVDSPKKTPPVQVPIAPARDESVRSKDSKRARPGHNASERRARDAPTPLSDPNKSPGPPKGTKLDGLMADLEEIECYHGNLLEEDIRSVISKNGDYIVRMASNPDGTKQVVVTIIVNDEKVDLAIRGKTFDTEGGKEFLYTLDNKTKCNNIKILLRRHTMMSTPVVRGKQEIWLLNPIAKQSWELRSENVELYKKLGEGAFGEVYSGKLRLPLKRFTNVAVKVIKRSSQSEKATMELQKEAAIMRKLKHLNIVRFYGIVVKKDSIMVVMELIMGGGLDKHLKTNPSTSMDDRSNYAADIACGLSYLHTQGVMHRDVACRNCLMDCYRQIAKVSDFGLARAAEEYKLRSDERIPIRWTAPEVVKTYVYTKAADIYAYAILVYEIFSNASLPFEGYSNAQIKEQIHSDTFRPKFPDGTPAEIIEIINKCWASDPASRPSLADVAKHIQTFCSRKNDDPGDPAAKPRPNQRNRNPSRESFSRVKRGGQPVKSMKSFKSSRTKEPFKKKASREVIRSSRPGDKKRGGSRESFGGGSREQMDQ